MWLCVCENIMKHFTACNIQYPECRHLTLFSCVMTILTSWKGLCGYDRDDMSCQDFCTVCLLRTFPSHYSICKQHVILVVQHLHVVFSCFLIFCDDFTNWDYCCESAIIYSMNGNPPVPFNRSLPLHEPWCIYPSNMCFFKIVVNGLQVAGKRNFISLSYAPIFIYKRCRTRESL